MHRTMNTSAKNGSGLLSIKDFAEICGASPSALRYWEERELIRPARRNMDNGYRYYLPYQAVVVSLIQTLVSLGVPLNSMAGIETNHERLLELYRDCDEQLDAKISELRTRRELMRSYAALVVENRIAQTDEIELCALPAQPYRRLDFTNNKPTSQIGRSCSPAGYAYNELYDLLEDPDNPSQLVVFDPLGPEQRPAGEYLVGTQPCRCGETGGLPRRMLEHALRHGLELQGPAYAVYLPGIADSEEYLLQIIVQVKFAADGL